MKDHPHGHYTRPSQHCRAPQCHMGGGGSGGGAPPRDLYAETAGELRAKADLAPRIFGAEAQYRPQYAGLDLATLQQYLNGTPGGSRDVQYTDTEHVAPTYRAAGPGDPGYGTPGGRGLAQLAHNGTAGQIQLTAGYDKPVVRTQSISTPSTPGLLELSNQAQTSQRTADISDVANLGPAAAAAFRKANPEQSALMAMLNQQATEGLQAGSNLGPQLGRQVQQSVRAGQAARGVGYGRGDVANEALFSGLQGQQLLQQRQGFAQGVVGLNQQTSVDPFLAILGRQSNALGQAGSYQRTSGPQLFGSSINANDVADSNFNAANARDIAGRNAGAATTGAAIGGGAAIAGSAILAIAL